jgi:hypothetical protein
MKKLILILCFFTSFSAISQYRFPQNNDVDYDDPAFETVKEIIDEARNNSQLEVLAHELLDVIGPRLTGTPQMKQAADWAVNKYTGWGINAELHEFGEWMGWERGITHIDMTSPRMRTLSGRQLAYSPSTSEDGITGEIVFIPEVENKQEFTDWLETIKGKFVLSSMYQPSGRPDYNWEKFATEESLQKIRNERKEAARKWSSNFRKMGVNRRKINSTLEEAGAIGLLSNNWAGGFGANRVFSAGTKNIPNIDLDLEDYTMLHRMVKSGATPEIKVVSTSKDLGTVPTFNTLAMIKGVEKPEEYVILSAHFDSWDGATGATDNGTGTIVMMEAMRILKAVYPSPKRTILVGHWGFEEGGLNGSRAFVEDFPDIVKNTQALFNQDNGTGRVINISGQGFLNSYEYVSRWLSPVPSEIKKHIKTNFPGMPGGGGSDYASFLAVGVPAFSLSSLDWSYRDYTWHTNIDTYDKIVFDDVRSNVILTAILAYMASEDKNKASREKRVMPVNPRTGKEVPWPNTRSPRRERPEIF